MQQKKCWICRGKKYIKLTKEPNLHGQIVQTLEQWKINYTYSLLMLKQEHVV